MTKLFFRNLLYILSVLVAAFGIFAILVGCLELLALAGGWGAVGLMIGAVLLVAYVSARNDFKDALAMEYRQSCIVLERAYDDMIYALQARKAEECENEIKTFQQMLMEHTIKYTADDTYAESYRQRYEALMKFYNLPV